MATPSKNLAWAGYEEQTWGKAENLPKVVVDDYFACKEGSEDNEDDPEDPEDPPQPLVVVSERDLLASLIEDRIDDLRVFQEMARGALKKKASESRAKPTRSQVKICKEGTDRGQCREGIGHENGQAQEGHGGMCAVHMALTFVHGG